MSYMAVLSAALAIRRGAHIRMTAFDRYLPKKALQALDIIADIFVFAFAIVMLVVGYKYAITIGAKGNYVSMPKVSRRSMISSLSSYENEIPSVCAPSRSVVS